MRKASGTPIAGIMALAFALAGCAGVVPGTVEDKPAATMVNMAGRWLVITPGAPSCGMIFGEGTDSGSIKPEGGCPGDFFTSRHWALEQDQLVIRDHNSEPLAQLRFVGGRFEGKSAQGSQITIARTVLPVN